VRANRINTPRLKVACTATLAARFLVLQYATPAIAPTARSCAVSPVLCWCASANNSVDAPRAQFGFIHRVSVGSKKPRNTVSSSAGASTTVVSTKLAAPLGPAANAFSIVPFEAVPVSSPRRPRAYERAVMAKTKSQTNAAARTASPPQSAARRLRADNAARFRDDDEASPFVD
jgi:hypothetical protein